MSHAIMLSFHGDPNIGLKAVVTDKFCILGEGLQKKYIEDLEKTLGVPVYQLRIYGTDLCGIFIVANSHGILVPNIVFDYEKEKLQKIAKELKVKIGVLKTDFTAIGNNMLCNDNVAIISSDFSAEDEKIIKSTLKVKIKKMDLADLKIPGALGVMTNKGAIFGQILEEKDTASLEKYLGFEIGLGTINMGSPFMHSGLIANSKGFVIGSLTSGYETHRIDEALRFI